MAWLFRFCSRLLEAHLAACTRRELHALSDHRLRDLGLSRDTIDSLYR